MNTTKVKHKCASIGKLRTIQHNFKNVSLRRLLAEPRVWCPDRSLNNIAVCQGVGESTSRKGRKRGETAKWTRREILMRKWVEIILYTRHILFVFVSCGRHRSCCPFPSILLSLACWSHSCYEVFGSLWPRDPLTRPWIVLRKRVFSFGGFGLKYFECFCYPDHKTSRGSRSKTVMNYSFVSKPR